MTSQLVNSLLAGSFSRVKGLQIKGIGQSRFEVTPAKGTAGPVLNAKIVIDPKEGVITQVTLENKGGNRSEVTLSDIVLGQPIEDLIFEFKAPPNTDLIRD
jgi:outer membrane lipoprotein-sorting protein